MPNTVLARIDAGAVFDGIPNQFDTTVEYLDPTSSQVNVFDLAVIRGDGIFEATTVWQGTPLALKLHLLRLQNSALRADFPALNLLGWEQALTEIVDKYTATYGTETEAHLKILVTRGADKATQPGAEQNPGVPHIWVYADQFTVDPNGKDEVKVITLPKAVSSTAVTDAPWMLYGVKTLSYAMNMATYREVARRGADNAVFYSTDNVVLEGPTSSIVWRKGNTCYTPDPSIGILHGTTQIELFAYLLSKGYEVEYGLYSPEQMRDADQAWQLGGSNAHTVVSIDGRNLLVDDSTAEANAFMRTERSACESYALAEWAKMHPGQEVPWLAANA